MDQMGKAWYLNEAFSAPARTRQEKLLQVKITLLVPLLHYREFAIVLRTLVQRRELSEPTEGFSISE